jgi:hypothetical protein
VCYQELIRIVPNAFSRSPTLTAPSLPQSLEKPFHLDYEQHLEPYVDNRSDHIDREIVDSHVAGCANCANELRDLLEFKQPVAGSRSQHTRAPGPSKWRFPQWQRLPLPHAALIAAVVIAVIILGLGFLLWTTRSRPPVERADQRTSPDNQTASTATNLPEPSPGATNSGVASQSQEGRPQQLLVALNDGGREIGLSQNGQVVGLDHLPPDLSRSISSVLRTGKFQQSPALEKLSSSSGNLRGGRETTDKLQLLTPGGIVIESDRPRFRWRAVDGARDYVVSIYDSELRKIGTSEPLSGTEWTTPTPLERGITYSWQIRAVKDGQTIIAPKPPAPEARFKILSRDEVAAIQNANRLHGKSHLAMAVLYWKYGLIDEAERELRALAVTNSNSPVAAELLRSLRFSSKR